ncbi:MAG TPA: hypothetical protein VIJ15_08805 [Dermatophilaceae bacterium]
MDSAQTARKMHKLLHAGRDHTIALSRFVAELDPDDERLLPHLLRDLDAARHREPTSGTQ